MFEGKNVHYSSGDQKPLCSYSSKLCKLRRLKGYAFCVRHILEDPTAPFRQCGFVVKNTSQRCTSAIPDKEEREYCHSHMQVMGIIPKKERKPKKTQSAQWNETLSHNGAVTQEGTTTTYLEQFNSHSLANGTLDTHKPSQLFSASKMFPELAGKLSGDGHQPENGLHNGEFHEQMTINCSDSQGSVHSKETKSKLSSPKRIPKSANNRNNGVSLNGLTHSLTSSWLESSSPTKSSHGSLSKRKRSTRKHLSILRKKQTGLLSEQEARERLSDCCYKTYSQYAVRKSYCADILTATVDSSDDEALEHIVHPNTQDLIHRHSASTARTYDRLLELKRQCLQLQKSYSANKESFAYKKEYCRNLINSMKDNLSCTAYTLRQMQVANKKEQVPPNRAQSALQRSMCAYRDQSLRKRCVRKPLPFAMHCTNHILQSSEQQLFEKCTYVDDLDGTQCRRSVLVSHEFCTEHSTLQLGEEPAEELSKPPTRRKPKPMALLGRSRKRKKKANTVPSNSTSESQPDFSSQPVEEATDVKYEPKTEQKPEESTGEFSDSDLMSPLDKTLELPLDHADSNLLEDSEIQQVLNKFDIFSDKNDFSELTEADADLILSTNDSHDIECDSELPEDITDTILHVESEQQAAAMRQQSLLHSSQQPQHYGMHSMENSFNGSDFRNHLQYSHEPPPPPQYPGDSKVIPVQGHMSEYMPTDRYHHGNTHQQTVRQVKLLSSQQQQAPSSLSGYQTAVSRELVPLPSSSTLLDPLSGGMRLPPVSTITSQQWSGVANHPFQNGYHQQQQHRPAAPSEQYQTASYMYPTGNQGVSSHPVMRQYSNGNVYHHRHVTQLDSPL